MSRPSTRGRTGVWSALALIVGMLATLPGVALGDQASQPGAPAAGFIGAGGFHSCAVLDGLEGAVRCWGFGASGQLGYGATSNIGDNETPRVVGPVDLGPGRTGKAVAVGSDHTCALLDDDNVRCWGFADEGRLGYGNEHVIGDDETPGDVDPVNLGEERTARAIAAGNGHTCAVLDEGSVRCWGFGLDGRLGYGDTKAIGDDETPGSAGPVKLGEGRTARAVTTGGAHTCALLDDDTVRCWGFAGAGRLGYGNTSDVGRTPETTPDTVGPVDLGEGRTARAITAGLGHTCAVLDNGSVRCWGSGASGRLGYGNDRNIGDDEMPGDVDPVNLGEGRTATAISAGEQHTCAVLDNGAVRCWGFGGFGQLGYGNGNSVGDEREPGEVDPVDLGPGRTAKAISAGGTHTCALLDDDSVRCWGYGVAGRLGYCNERTIGDNESPGSAGPVDLGTPGVAGARCPAPPESPGPGPAPAPAPAPEASPPAPAAPTPAPARVDQALAAQAARASALRACLRGVPRGDGRRAVREARRRCGRLHGRTPGRVRRFVARPAGRRAIRLVFRAPGSDGSSPPAARSYVIKQSNRAIRSRRAFRRAPALCTGSCSFKVTEVGARLVLRVTGLSPRRRYFFSIAARDNVSERIGGRSNFARARPGGKPKRQRR